MPVRNPGRKKVTMTVKTAVTKFVSLQSVKPIKTVEQRPIPLPTSVNKQAKKMMTKRGERRPPSGRILQGPALRFLARPREEVITELAKARKKTTVFRGFGSQGL